MTFQLQVTLAIGKQMKRKSKFFIKKIIGGNTHQLLKNKVKQG